MGNMGVDPLGATIPALSALAALSPGDVVAERYRVEALLGQGTMGVVYRVEHLHMRKRFALKVLGGECVGTPDAFARFEREAMAAGRIANPHVAQATDFGRLADGGCFLVLEYVDGRTLRSVLKRGALRPGRALRIARGVVSAMTAAHALGVVHRDLKPENIMLVDHDGDSDYVKVLDFGLAKLEGPAGAGPSSRVLTRQGALVGTPAYMSPEQAIGERVDPRADLYAVGVILFEMLAGDCPFRGDPVSVLRQHVLEEAPPLPRAVRAAVDARVVEMLRRLLAKVPDARYATAIELGAALDECLTAGPPNEGSEVAAERPSPEPCVPDDRGAASRREAIATSVASSPLARLSAFIGRLRPRPRRLGARVAFAWSTALVGRVRSWRRRRRLHAMLAVPSALARRVRAWLARRELRWPAWQWGLAFAVATAALLFWMAKGSQHGADAGTPSATASPSAARGPSGVATGVTSSVPKRGPKPSATTR
jgi:hypothetical protein